LRQLLFVIKPGRLGDNPEIWKALHRSSEGCERPVSADYLFRNRYQATRNRSFHPIGVNSNIGPPPGSVQLFWQPGQPLHPARFSDPGLSLESGQWSIAATCSPEN
jgi:hypothetical protein